MGDGTMKIAVTAKGSELTSEVDPRFGRAKYFVIVNLETDEFAAADNEQNLNAPQGAGIQAAQNVSRLGAEYVLTGHCGPNAFRTLAAAGIKLILNVSGTVAGAIEDFKNGKLRPTESADVEGHWV